MYFVGSEWSRLKTQRRTNPMRISSQAEARTNVIATALSLPLAFIGAVLTLGLFGSVV